MESILQFEADRRAFIITINSFGTELTMDDREKLYPTCGKLHPDGLVRLARCEDYDQVKAVADCYAVCVDDFLILYRNIILYVVYRNMRVSLLVQGIIQGKSLWKTNSSKERY